MTMSITMADLKPFKGRWYTASFHEPSRQIRIVGRKSRFYLFAPIVSACDRPGQRDITGALSDFRMRRRGAAACLTFTEQSALWDRKEYTIEFRPDHIIYYYKVYGKGTLSRAYLLRSWLTDPVTVEEELGVAPGFDTLFSPAVNFEEKVYHFPGDTAIIPVGNDRSHWSSGLSGAPFCFCLNERGDDLWVWAGLGVRDGRYTFEEFTWNENPTKRVFGPGGFSCNYNGKLSIDGVWESPHLVLGAAKDPYQGQERYVTLLEKEYGLRLPHKRKIPAWWRTPIFCGWGEQIALAFRDHGNLEVGLEPPYCTQALHDEWMAILRARGIKPGQIIIDDGWQADGTIGDLVVHKERWPDLRGWIEARRAEGIRTVLWMCAWHRAGVPDDECMTQDGKPVNVDPTNPEYEKRLRAMVRRLLSREPGCYNADGLKVDGLLGCPFGPGLKSKGNVWGLELQRCYMQILYDEAKHHKPDAMIGTYLANPYLADLSDVVRTADQFTIKGSPESTLVHRARMLSIGQPGCPIDTDSVFNYDMRENWVDIMETQLSTGIPSLYNAKYVRHKRPFMRPYMEAMTEAHYRVIRRVFEKYWKKIGSIGF